ncbi:Rne/Rng family ribonuclease [Asticcacaulis sp. SL142]|uniref:Rne/Rng family ribonuclease n=1 Tax=Asticcacaulis sp. SL142 TaxID=2995155 RepID=UPI003B63CCDA
MSLAGRYCVLMPNTARGGGISRKITNSADRKRLKVVAQSLDVPQGMGLIVRTAGAKRTKQEIKRDYDYLLRVWENIRETTLKSNAPSLIYEEEDLVKRAIRDLFDKDFEHVMVEGEEGYRSARDFMRMIMPSQAKKIQLYRANAPLFARHGIEDMLQKIYSPTVPLRSGGYLVINQTEALVAIDVNSGKSTKERNIENTALKTNLEAAEEAARQMRLRDLAGLVVIDFIDMDEPKNNRAVEKKLKDALENDRARIQMGKISGFGLMEISRQRRRTGFLEGTTSPCPHCEGTGRIRSVDSSALGAMRAIDLEAMQNGAGAVIIKLPQPVALYVLNEKQGHLAKLREEWGLKVTVEIENHLSHAEFEITRTVHADEVEFVPPVRSMPAADLLLDAADEVFEDEELDAEDEEAIAREDTDDDGAAERAQSREDGRDGGRDGRGRGRNRRRRRKGENGNREPDGEAEADAETAEAADTEADDDSDGSDGDSDDRRNRRRRRGRRGGRRTGQENRPREPYGWVRARTPSLEEPYVWIDAFDEQQKRVDPQVSDAIAASSSADSQQTPLPEGVPKDVRRERSRNRRNRSSAAEAVSSTAMDVITPVGSVEVAPRALTEPVDGSAPTSLVPEDMVSDAPVRRKRPTRSRKVAVAAEAETVADDTATISVEVEPAVAPEVVEVAPEPVAAEDAGKTTRKPRARRKKTDVVAESLTETVTAPMTEATDQAEVIEAPAPVDTTVSVLERPLVEVQSFEPAPSVVDPAEITTPPEKPKRGWWRK